MRRTYFIVVRGRQHQWAFNIELDPKHEQELKDDGLEIGQLWYGIPDWVVNAGLGRVWMFAADVFHFRNPFA